MSAWTRLFSRSKKQKRVSIQSEFNQFESALWGSLDDSVHLNASGEKTHVVDTALMVIVIFLMTRNKNLRAKSRRESFSDEVHRGIKEGDILLRDDEDLQLFPFFHTHEDTADIVHIAKHYIETGEMLEILHLAKRRYESTGHGTTPFEVTAEQMNKLYAFDMTQLKEMRSQGDDENSLLGVPLEVRAHLAGCYEEVLT